MKRQHLLLALLVVVVWGINFVVIRWGLDELPPMLLAALRFVFVAFPAILFIRPPKLPLKWLLGYGLTISFGQFALLFMSMYLGMPAGLASLVLQAQALFTLLFAVLLLGESWSAKQVLSLTVAATGLTLLASETGSTGVPLIAFLLTIAAASAWGLGNIINRKISQFKDVDLLAVVVWAGLIPIIPFLILSYTFEGQELIMTSLSSISWKSVVSIAYLALFATLFGYGSWAFLLKRYPASEVAPLTLMVPVTGLISAWLLLGETLSMVQIAGILVVLAGLALNTLKVPALIKTRTSTVKQN